MPKPKHRVHPRTSAILIVLKGGQIQDVSLFNTKGNVFVADLDALAGQSVEDQETAILLGYPTQVLGHSGFEAALEEILTASDEADEATASDPATVPDGTDTPAPSAPPDDATTDPTSAPVTDPATTDPVVADPAPTVTTDPTIAADPTVDPTTDPVVTLPDATAPVTVDSVPAVAPVVAPVAAPVVAPVVVDDTPTGPLPNPAAVSA